MGKRTGRPAAHDRPALRRVAEYLADIEAEGRRCSVRAAILRTTAGEVAGHSRDAMLWRLQRKWRQDGGALLAEARERRSARREPVRGGLPVYGGLGYASELARLALAETRVARVMLQHQEALRVLREHRDAVLQAFGPLEELRRVLEGQDALRRFLGCR